MKQPIDKSVKALAHTAQYKMHKYFARRPYNVFQNFIEHYTNEGDLILDVFCGGGVTVFESAALNRRAIGVDLNPLATFITEMQLKSVPLNDLKQLTTQFIEEIEQDFKQYYQFNHNDKAYTIEWTEWAYEVQCPHCGESIILDEKNKALSHKTNKPKNGFYVCPNTSCKGSNLYAGVKRTDCKPISSYPLRVKAFNDVEKVVINLTSDQSAAIKTKKYMHLIPNDFIVPDEEIPLNWDRTHEDKLIEKGVTKFSDLFTERNFVINTLVFNKILNLKQSYDVNLIDCLYFIFSSSLRYTNKMSRVSENWENGNPTAMDKHAYWLPNVYIESNVIEKFKDRCNSILKGLEFTNSKIPNSTKKLPISELLQASEGYEILNQSSSNLHQIPDKSIDAIITDPPYGSNVQYSELSSFWNVWLKAYRGMNTFIYNDKEAVMNRKKNIVGFKDLDHYEQVLFEVYSECNRVLKDDGYLVFTFNNKNLKVWIALIKATIRAGFIIPENGIIFQDFIDSYKNTSHLKYSGNVHGDFVYSFIKGTNSVKTGLIGKNPLDYISNYISSVIEKMYDVQDSYTTTQLYEKIFNGLIQVLSDLISANIDSLDEQFEEINNQSNDLIDQLLKKELVFENDVWKKKVENLC